MAASGEDAGSHRPWIIITNVTLDKPITFEQQMIFCSICIEMKNIGKAPACNVMAMITWDSQYLIRGNGLLKMPKLDMETETERMRRLVVRNDRMRRVSGNREPTFLMPGCVTTSDHGMGTRVGGPKTERVFLLFGIRAGYWFEDELQTTDSFFMINQKDTGIGIQTRADGTEIHTHELRLNLFAEMPFIG